MAIRYHHDLYPADDPRDGTRVVRFTHHQKAHYEHVRNGAGSGLVELRGTTSDAQLIAPAGMQYVRVVEENTVAVTETVRGGYFLEEGDFLALDRKRLKRLKFGGTGTLSYLDREIMWSHSYLDELGFSGTMDPFDRIWRLWNQGDWAGGDYLGAILWRVISEGLAYRTGATYTHRHATGDEFGIEFTDSHADDKLETAIPQVTLGFDQFVDSLGNAWTVGSGEFEAQVGDSLFEVTKRLMDAGLYVELDPDTFELRAWEVANHGRDRTGLAWGANVVRFEPPPSPSTDRSAGNILNDLKRTLRPFIKVTALLAGGGEDTYAVATASGVVPWHRFRPLDINDTTALSAAATRDISRRNDAGDTLLVRAKVGSDPANGYYLPEEHAKLDDLVTVHSGTDTWDWDEAAYPIAKWSVTSRRTGAPDVFYHLGASYHAGASKEFAGGSGVGRHTHPPNPRLCDPSIACEHLTDDQLTAGTATNGDAEAGASTQWSGGAASGTHFFEGAGGIAIASSADGTIGYTFDSGQPFPKGTRFVIRFWSKTEEITGQVDVRFGVAGGDEETAIDLLELEQTTGDDGETWALRQMCWTPSGDRTGVRVSIRHTQAPAGYIAVDSLTLSTANDELSGTSNRAARCGHRHRAQDIVFNGPAADMAADNLQDAVEELKTLIGSGAFVEKINGGNETANVVNPTGATETINLATGNHQDFTLDTDCAFTMPVPGRGKSFTAFVREDGIGGHTPTFTGVEWPGDVTPDFDETAGAVNIVAFVSDDATWYGVVGTTPGAVVAALDDLTDVAITTPVEGEKLRYNGTLWVNANLHDEPMIGSDGLVMVTGNLDPMMHEVAW